MSTSALPPSLPPLPVSALGFVLDSLLLLGFGLRQLAGGKQPWGGRPAVCRDAPSPPDMQLGRWLTLAPKHNPSATPLLKCNKNYHKEEGVFTFITFLPFSV